MSAKKCSICGFDWLTVTVTRDGQEHALRLCQECDGEAVAQVIAASKRASGEAGEGQ